MKVWLKNILKTLHRGTLYKYIKLKNTLKGNKHVRSKFLFILSPPFCGSTLLNEIISTSQSVSNNNSFGTREGQTLPEVREMMLNKSDRWNEDARFDWPFIKSTWLKYWDRSKPILLEKSPPNIIRGQYLQQYFDPSFFILFTRNPYAHCESLMRRGHRTPDNAAEFAIKCLQFQKQNGQQLKHVVQLTYEELTDAPTESLEKIKFFLPELNDIALVSKFHAHNFKGKNLGIQNLNAEKIKNLTSDEIEHINHVFNKHVELLNWFGYKIIEDKAGI